MIRGIDISSYQGDVDFVAVKTSGVEFVYAKATEGVSWTDDRFAGYVNNCVAVGLPIGAYHFAHPENDPIVEADHFISTISPHLGKLTLMPVLDLELPTSRGNVTPEHIVQWATSFSNRIYARIGRTVMLYTGVWYVNEFDGLGGLAKMPLWVSVYESAVPRCGDWTSWVAWQYADNGTVPGIAGSVDMDYAVSLDALRGGAITKGVSNMAQSTVSMGDSNAYVKQLQSELNALGYSVGTPDGVFGSLTQEGVKSFQSSHGLTSDGVVGPMTWAALSRDSVKPTVKPVTTPVATPTTNPAGTSATLTDAERTQLFEQFVSAMRQLLNVKS